ncbi:MAG: SDR family NAD(P)-dependent oxidoreductase, partial [Archangium sp.]|nr:SDR family NAD(P)-dependent oxidoreductase [Archangium sp.]
MPLALVTGGAIRVGRAIALALGRAGFDVVVHANRSADAAQAVVKELNALGRQARAELADLSSEAGPRELANRINGPLDVLVNSAATYEHAAFEQ